MSHPPGTQDLLTVREAARLLRLGEITVYRLAQRRKIPAVKVGGSWRFSRSLLEQWLMRGGSGAARRILVVDDDPGLRRTLEEVLAVHGQPTALAGSVREAQALLKEGSFDLVFLDVILPDGTGADVFRALRAIDPAALVVLMTGFPDHPAVAEALALGPVMLMRKPFGFREVDDVLRITARQGGSPAVPGGARP
ncbi:MAG: response regulator [Candidatus Methylomirabilales bacterium]